LLEKRKFNIYLCGIYYFRLKLKEQNRGTLSHQGQWGPPQQGGPPMGMAGNMGPMGGPNGQMGGPMMGGPMGPPGNMMQQYQGWGTSPQTGGYAGYSTQYNAQGWGAPPGPPQQQQIPPPPPHQWGSSYNVQPAAATQGYGSYGEFGYNSEKSHISHPLFISKY